MTPPQPDIILLRYNEIALKGGNRRAFEQKLAENIEHLFKNTAGLEVRVEHVFGRLLLRAPWNAQTKAILGRACGLFSFSPAHQVTTDLPAITSLAADVFAAKVARDGIPPSFCVRTKRSEKALPETSIEIDRLAGAAIFERCPGLKVNLNKPDLMIGIEIRHNNSYIWIEKYRAMGGLPVGSNGRVLTLLSGGIDSPVAAILALKRGCPTHFLHFDGTPFVDREALLKVQDLVRLIHGFMPNPGKLFVVPFGKIQEQVALATKPRFRTVLYRRLMMRIANELARKLEAHAIVTGENLGQVASQTLENLAVINSASSLPVLRPLLTFDKGEIIALAEKYGTFETSIRPAADCCALFADRSPILHARENEVTEEEARFDGEALILEAMTAIHQ